MKIEKERLIKALEIVKPGLSNKDMIEQATSFAFMGGRVVTYNDEISISHPVEDLDITGAVKAEELYQLLGKIKQKDVTFEVDEHEVRITAGKARAGITLQQEIRLPLDEIGEIGKWKRVPKNLKEAMKFAMFSCSKDMSRPVLTCLHVTSTYVESCDNLRLTRYNLDADLPVKEFLIPVSIVKDLINYDFVAIAEGMGWIHFKSKDATVFSCRVFEDAYPNVSSLLKVAGDSFILPAGLGEVLKRAEVFSKRDNVLEETVVVGIQKNLLKIRSEDESGWFEEELELSSESKVAEVEFAINPGFLNDMLSRQTTCALTKDRMKFTGEGWEHVVALL
ncbi:MAG: hypothetical protein WC992_03560 [Acholeplasmataceae bacterium]|jgi:DNA polymerase III sliding clamp (beta) subunit (PCNA family)